MDHSRMWESKQGWQPWTMEMLCPQNNDMHVIVGLPHRIFSDIKYPTYLIFVPQQALTPVWTVQLTDIKEPRTGSRLYIYATACHLHTRM